MAFSIWRSGCSSTQVRTVLNMLRWISRYSSRSAGVQRGLFGSSQDFAGLLSQIPGMGGGLADTARDLQARSAAQEYENETAKISVNTSFDAPPGSSGGPAGPAVPGMSPSFDPIKTAKQIYPILEFRDKIVKAINATIAKIPGLEALVERISETLSLFILSLLAPFVRPIIEAVSASLKQGSSTIVEARYVLSLICFIHNVYYLVPINNSSHGTIRIAQTQPIPCFPRITSQTN